MNQSNLIDEYIHALKLGQKEKKRLEALGKRYTPLVLEDEHPEVKHATLVELPVQDIPIDRIIGTKTSGRVNTFSASFMPLLDEGSEFASKWIALCKAHLSDVGICDPIECYEYLGNFYVLEGNKRVSVLKYFGALHICAHVYRVSPIEDDSDEYLAYQEFLDFYEKTKMYDVQFKKPGGFLSLYNAIGKKKTDSWESEEIKHFASVFFNFKSAFLSLANDSDLFVEEALLLFLKVYSYDQLSKMSEGEIKKNLVTLWGDVKATSEPNSINLKTIPEEAEPKSLISKIITNVKHLNVAFVYQQDEEKSPWTKGHFEGSKYLGEKLGDSVTISNYFNANSPKDTLDVLDKAASDGNDIIFTTTPLMLESTLKAKVKYPKIKFFNCSTCKPLSSVRSYYCRIYEGKFITGMIAGALASNDLVGYVGSYPILGVIASINAFSLGVRMTNPRAKVVLKWSCLNLNSVEALANMGINVISNRDIPLPNVSFIERGRYGTFIVSDNKITPIASPCWMWGKMYEKIIRNSLSGTIEKNDSQAINYWWGMDSGVIDVKLTDLIPEGVKSLALSFIDQVKKGTYDVFSQKLLAQDGSTICDGETKLTSLEILQMNKLAENVIGEIPEYKDLLPMSRALVKELGENLVTIPSMEEEE